MNSLKLYFLIFIILILIINKDSAISLQDETGGITQVIILGSGNPNPDPNHQGCSVAIVVNDTPYIIDFGPGLIRQAAAMSPRYGGKIKGLDVANIKTAFLTHLHSDHTTGYPDLIFTPWTMGRNAPLEVYGPAGIKDMTDNILKAYKEDVDYRTNGLEPANNIGYKVNAHEFEEGVIYTDKNIKVEAFHVEHGTWPNAYGFRFTTPDKIIVLSGDTRPCEKLLKYAEGADILIHEVYSQAGFEKRSDDWKKYHSLHHTSTLELGEIASKAKPKIVLLYHILYWGNTDQQLIDEIKTRYNGKVIVGKDLGIY